MFQQEAPAPAIKGQEARLWEHWELSPERKESAVRFSLCEFTTKEELDYTLEALREILPMLRRYARK